MHPYPEVFLNFIWKDSTLCVIVATISFGIGLDCPNIRRIIHWGPPEDIETYIQETGRAGLPATATQYSAVKDLATQKMKELKPEECRRKHLLSLIQLILLLWTLTL